MPITIYYMPSSAPCRAVLLLAKHLDLFVNLAEINILAGEQLSPTFLSMNPEHVVPTIDDDGFYLWESRAILGYFVNKYAEDDVLYSMEPQKRARIDRMLYFDIGTLYRAFADFTYPQMIMKTLPEPIKEKKLQEAVEFFDMALHNSKYAAANTITIADFSLVATVSTIQVTDFDLTKYPKVFSWLETVRNDLPYFNDVCQRGLMEFQQWYLQSTL